METQTRKVRVVCFYGAKNGNAKLTARRVREIRNLYAGGGETCRSLAEKFEVSRQTVYNVIERVVWRGVAV
jgi:transposase